jgi:hypothetical protein
MPLKEIREQTLQYCQLMETAYTEKIKALNISIEKAKKKLKKE